MKVQYVQTQLATWYEQHHRILPWRETRNPYCIWISEIILQQTRVVQGYEYYMRFLERFPDVQTLAEASEDEVMLYWQGLGYYSRARNLHYAAQQVMNIYGGVFPDNYKDVRSLKGVGDYTAAAVCSFAYNQPYAVVDGNVYRVLSRLYDEDTPIDSAIGKKLFQQQAEALLNRDNARLHNQAMMEFGALQCTPQSPNCAICPLQEVCLSYRHQTQKWLPVKQKQTTLKERFLNYIVYVHDGQTLIYQRKEKDIWKHLYEFPLYESDHLWNETEVQTLLPSGRLVKASKELIHILSHQRLHARFFVVETDQLTPAAGQQQIGLSHLSDYALSRLTQRGIEEVF